MTRIAPIAALTLALAALAGCGGSGPATVSGTVKVDGQPLKQGLIKFVPADGKSQSADTVITDGRYIAEVPIGDKRVEITGSKVVGKTKMYDTPDSPTVDQVVEILPDRYHSKSELTYTVKSGNQTKDFDLKGK